MRFFELVSYRPGLDPVWFLTRPNGAAGKPEPSHFADIAAPIHFWLDENEYFMLTGVIRLYIYLQIQLTAIR